LSDADDELEEIKRLIRENSGSPAAPSKKLVPAKPRQDIAVAPKDAEKSGYPVIGRVAEGSRGIVMW